LFVNIILSSSHDGFDLMKSISSSVKYWFKLFYFLICFKEESVNLVSKWLLRTNLCASKILPQYFSCSCYPNSPLGITQFAYCHYSHYIIWLGLFELLPIQTCHHFWPVNNFSLRCIISFTYDFFIGQWCAIKTG